ncbi:MAG: pyruvate ferredoxin oxidoreductase [Chloroflexi bacterium]|nr:pyruvate ferredoxin oxidoreductase [Chloroflexota bacterium]
MATVSRQAAAPTRGTGKLVALTGAAVVAHAMRQIHPDVVAAYPITPQTIITETFSEFVADGEVQTEFVAVESEHAAMSACIGAAAAGARVQTATSGPGLALMWEVLWVASGSRLPIVMHLCTRALSAPINILCDHSDAYGMRETGWVMLVGENAQEAYDNAIQAVRIAEHPEVLLPVANVLDGFVVTHCLERVEFLPDQAVQEFVGEYHARYGLLDPSQTVTIGPLAYHDSYTEHKRNQVAGMERALEVSREIAGEYGRLTGRYYDVVDAYRLEDAEVAVVLLGSAAGTVRHVVDQLRGEGIRAGMLRVRCYRPFPSREVAEALRHVKVVGVLDRGLAFGAPGNPLFSDVCLALYTHGLTPPVYDFVYGLGGRSTMPPQLRQAFEALLQPTAPTGTVTYLGLREGG